VHNLQKIIKIYKIINIVANIKGEVKMKKFVMFGLVAFFGVSLLACGSKKQTTETPAKAAVTEEQTVKNETEGENSSENLSQVEHFEHESEGNEESQM
jgi:hypothetical protein